MCLLNLAVVIPLLRMSLTAAQAKALTLRRAAESAAHAAAPVGGKTAADIEHDRLMARLHSVPAVGRGAAIDGKHSLAAGPLVVAAESRAAKCFEKRPDLAVFTMQTPPPSVTSVEEARKAVVECLDAAVPSTGSLASMMLVVNDAGAPDPEVWEHEFFLPKKDNAHFGALGKERFVLWARDPGTFSEVEVEYLQACQRDYIGLCQALVFLREAQLAASLGLPGTPARDMIAEAAPAVAAPARQV